jgi:hypothetical protein
MENEKNETEGQGVKSKTNGNIGTRDKIKKEKRKVKCNDCKTLHVDEYKRTMT